MGYPLILDYAGGHIPGAALAAAGVSGVCRYINDGGTGLPKKLLTADEFIDLCQNGIRVHFNFETTATFMLTDNGAADARTGLAYVQGLFAAAEAAGIDTSGYEIVIYFSADFDEPPEDDTVIDAFFDSAKSVLGVNGFGKSCAGGYGAYWLLTRAHASGHVDYLWQTEAWSGGNIDSAIAIMQRNALGYMNIAGVECDINEAHADDTGAFIPKAVEPQGNGGNTVTTQPTDSENLAYAAAQLGPWKQLNGDAQELARIKQCLADGVPLTFIDWAAAITYGIIPFGKPPVANA